MTKCHLCFRNTLIEFLDLGLQPLANKYPTEQSPAEEEFFPTQVFFCSFCKNIQLGTIVSRNTMFEDYYYLSSVNTALVNHYEKFARTLTGARFVVDAGSNDGISLKPLKEMGIKAIGVDPSINVGKLANDAGYKTLVSFFDAQAVDTILKEYGQADVITGFSMFSHLEDQHQFIEDAKRLLTDDGRLVIEVEYNVSMIQKMAFERFYLDRVCYFSVTSFANLFNMHGMYLTDVELTEIHGGSLRVTAQKIGKGREPKQSISALLAQEELLLDDEILHQFGEAAKAHIGAFKAKLVEYQSRGLKVAGYGSPARVATLTNFGDIGPDLIEFIVDDSPLKQHRFSPGKHIPIVPNSHLATHKPDVLVVFAHEYFDDIRTKLVDTYTFLLPIPPREVV